MDRLGKTRQGMEIMTNKLYSVYFNPTQKGKDAFGWVRHKLGGGMTKDAAGEFAYLERRDEQAPDFHEYGSIDVEIENG